MSTTLHDLSPAERKWLYTAIWKVIVSDGQVSKEEFHDLREAMAWVPQEEFEALRSAEAEQMSRFPLARLEGLEFDKAFLMLTEVIRVATADARLLLGELTFIEHFGQLLGFEERAIERALEWAEQVRQVSLAKMGLAQHCRAYFKP